MQEMSANDLKWSHECTFPSSMDTAHEIIDKIVAEIEQRHWSSKDRFAVQMALEEAFVNAVMHGNQFDPSKIVRFSCELTDSRFVFRVEDEGAGFDPHNIPNPTDEEHILVASGRGVLLIKSFVTNVVWNDKGNIITVEKVRSD